ncbi:Dynein heavy chain, cytoplasmic [Hondaea fermentalgiana]|uniref:Midasin n=1 Tax=Hondaea fermentalgiana TaxID=2315210 RepID=A0A2R5GM63_9STRA|nr:Dynein heavy chain, cytoplasmic [Hondaea fermentalgiana]|eukprot:GBG29381.1 Dynein heavy chain, cytoplasmic [Hondaea fermentalgiana]
MASAATAVVVRPLVTDLIETIKNTVSEASGQRENPDTTRYARKLLKLADRIPEDLNQKERAKIVKELIRPENACLGTLVWRIKDPGMHIAAGYILGKLLRQMGLGSPQIPSSLRAVDVGKREEDYSDTLAFKEIFHILVKDTFLVFAFSSLCASLELFQSGGRMERIWGVQRHKIAIDRLFPAHAMDGCRVMLLEATAFLMYEDHHVISRHGKQVTLGNFEPALNSFWKHVLCRPLVTAMQPRNEDLEGVLLNSLDAIRSNPSILSSDERVRQLEHLGWSDATCSARVEGGGFIARQDVLTKTCLLLKRTLRDAHTIPERRERRDSIASAPDGASISPCLQILQSLVADDEAQRAFELSADALSILDEVYDLTGSPVIFAFVTDQIERDSTQTILDTAARMATSAIESLGNGRSQDHIILDAAYPVITKILHDGSDEAVLRISRATADRLASTSGLRLALAMIHVANETPREELLMQLLRGDFPCGQLITRATALEGAQQNSLWPDLANCIRDVYFQRSTVCVESATAVLSSLSGQEFPHQMPALLASVAALADRFPPAMENLQRQSDLILQSIKNSLSLEKACVHPSVVPDLLLGSAQLLKLASRDSTFTENNSNEFATSIVEVAPLWLVEGSSSGQLRVHGADDAQSTLEDSDYDGENDDVNDDDEDEEDTAASTCSEPRYACRLDDSRKMLARELFYFAVKLGDRDAVHRLVESKSNLSYFLRSSWEDDDLTSIIGFFRADQMTSVARILIEATGACKFQELADDSGKVLAKLVDYMIRMVHSRLPTGEQLHAELPLLTHFLLEAIKDSTDECQPSFAKLLKIASGLDQKSCELFDTTFRTAKSLSQSAPLQPTEPSAVEKELHASFLVPESETGSSTGAAESLQRRPFDATMDRLSHEELVEVSNRLDPQNKAGPPQLCDSSEASTEDRHENDLVQTKTTQANIGQILELVKSPSPILLEGATGAGKSATVLAAATQAGKSLLRFNMSRTITPDDLLLSIKLGQKGPEATEQPFTLAFSRGDWLLLDEINLAEEQVIQSIQEALDSGVLKLKDPTNSESHLRQIQMHPDFRLFATQNPNAGFFKNKREPMSSSTLSRFIPLIFKPLPTDELVEIAHHKLCVGLPSDLRAGLKVHAETLLEFHDKVCALTANADSRFPEQQAYASFSIREVLAVVRFTRGCISIDANTHVSHIAAQLAQDTWRVYARRFRRLDSLDRVWTIFPASWRRNYEGWRDFEASTDTLKETRFKNEPSEDEIYAFYDRAGGKEVARELQLLESTVQLLARAQAAVSSLLGDPDVVKTYGVHLGLSHVWQIWVKNYIALALKNSGLEDPDLRLAEICIEVAASIVRAEDLQDRVAKSILDALDERISSAVDVQNILKEVRAGPVPRSPIAFTPRLERLLAASHAALHSQLPLLIVGPCGTGKSVALRVLADLRGFECIQAYLTGETEASLLIGSQQPISVSTGGNDGGPRSSIAWRDGLVTQSLKDGSWVLLDNISDADPCVLERLNPLLEDPVDWRLTEKGEVEPLWVPGSFRVVATMLGQASGRCTELSPALSNRFSAIFLPSIEAEGGEALCEEVKEVARVILSLGSTEDAEQQLSEVAETLISLEKTEGQAKEVQLRTITRILDSAYRLRRIFPGSLDLKTSIDTAHNIVHGKPVDEALASISQEHIPKDDQNKIVLTGARLQFACGVQLAQLCGHPVLLEGPAAVGKTALVGVLARQSNKRLLRVNNTAATTIYDYFGSFLPSGGGLVFNDGPLTRALQKGDWFLADELNLADPSILSMLAPLLEGASMVRVADSDRMVAVHPEFRFFATQNPAGREFAGRNQLPPTLRSRFVVFIAKEYSTASNVQPDVDDELSVILQKRCERLDGRELPPVPQDVSRLMSRVYGELRPDRTLRLSFRELVKWRRRFHQLERPSSEDWRRVGYSLIASRAATATQKSKVAQVLRISELHHPVRLQQDGSDIRVSLDGLHVTVHNANLRRASLIAPHVMESGELDTESLPSSFVQCLAQVLVAANNKEPILLVGPTSFKTTMFETWCSIAKNLAAPSPVVCHLSPDTETSDLIGQVHPYSPASALQELQSVLQRAFSRARRETQGSGDWVVRCEGALSVLAEKINIFQKEERHAGKLRSDEEHELEQAQTSDHLAAEMAQYDADNESDEGDDSETRSASSETHTSGSWTHADSLASHTSSSGTSVDGSGSRSSASFVHVSHPTGQSLSLSDAGMAEDDPFADSDDDTGGDAQSRRPKAPLAPPPFTLKDGPDDPFLSSDDEVVQKAPLAPPPSTLKDGPDDPFLSSDDEVDQAPDESKGVEDPFASDDSSDDKGDAKRNAKSSSFLRENVSASQPQRYESVSDDESDNVSDADNKNADENVFDLEILHRMQLMNRSARGNTLAFQACVSEVITTIDLMRECLPDDDKELEHAERLHAQVQQVVESASGDPIFAFREGPVTSALSAGVPILFEDFDLPDQAVPERLNSVFEPEPAFTLVEDVARAASGQDIAISSDFQVFATVHYAEGQQLRNISPATRSRFTEIHVPALLPQVREGQEITMDATRDITHILAHALGGGAPANVALAKHLINVLLEWKQTPAGKRSTISDLLRVCRFVAAQSEHGLEGADDRSRLAVLGMRFLLLDGAAHVGLNALSDVKNVIARVNPAEDLDALFAEPSEEILRSPFQEIEHKDGRLIRCEYGGLVARMNDSVSQRSSMERFGLHVTKTAVQNVARIFAAISAQSPLLLEGPPGIGKTASVEAVARLLGFEVKRINFSANTTPEQLFGSIIPRSTEDGKRVFEWQDGPLIEALKSKKWLLLDELNLAPPETLEAIAPVFSGRGTFKVPGSNEDIAIHNLQVFATMNPVGVGGGRAKLPRSIENLFSVVRLGEYNRDELFDIFQSAFKKLIEEEVLMFHHLEALFEIHWDLQDLASQKKIGKGHGGCGFNLRDLMKLRDLLAGNAANITDHFASENVPLQTDIRSVILKRLASIVYVDGLQSAEEQVLANQVLDKHLPVEDLLQARVTRELDRSVTGSLRIGAVYLNQGLHESDAPGLVPTDSTLMHLEALGMVVQSNRSVLLEGPSGSGKTSLVKELARLMKRRLVVLSLTDSTETSDLIGQWVPAQLATHAELAVRPFFESLMSRWRLFLAHVFPIIVKNKNKTHIPSQEVLEALPADIQGAFDIERAFNAKSGGSGRLELVEQLLEAVLRLQSVLKSSASVLSSLAASEERHHLRMRTSRAQRWCELESKRAVYDEIKIRHTIEDEESSAPVGSSASDLAFQFVESELVRAMREGDFVLLDNVNSAPPEVLERLNSLFEADPSLALLESGSSDVFTADGRDQTTPIHSEFRIFCTANAERINSFKLSSAFLNRVIRLWLPAIDADCNSGGTLHTIVCSMLPRIDPLSAYVWALWHIYLESMQSACRPLALRGLVEILKDSNVAEASMATDLVRSGVAEDPLRTWKRQKRSFIQTMSFVETKLGEALVRLVESVPAGKERENVTKDIVEMLLQKEIRPDLAHMARHEIEEFGLLAAFGVDLEQNTRTLQEIHRSVKVAFDKAHNALWKFVNDTSLTNAADRLCILERAHAVFGNYASVVQGLHVPDSELYNLVRALMEYLHGLEEGGQSAKRFALEGQRDVELQRSATRICSLLGAIIEAAQDPPSEAFQLMRSITFLDVIWNRFLPRAGDRSLELSRYFNAPWNVDVSDNGDMAFIQMERLGMLSALQAFETDLARHCATRAQTIKTMYDELRKTESLRKQAEEEVAQMTSAINDEADETSTNSQSTLSDARHREAEAKRDEAEVKKKLYACIDETYEGAKDLLGQHLLDSLVNHYRSSESAADWSSVAETWSALDNETRRQIRTRRSVADSWKLKRMLSNLSKESIESPLANFVASLMFFEPPEEFVSAGKECWILDRAKVCIQNRLLSSSVSLPLCNTSDACVVLIVDPLDPSGPSAFAIVFWEGHTI